MHLSIKLALIDDVIAEGWASCNRNTDSITVISVDVVSIPVKAHQSLTTIPAPTTSLPLFTVPAYKLRKNIILQLLITSTRVFTYQK